MNPIIKRYYDTNSSFKFHVDLFHELFQIFMPEFSTLTISFRTWGNNKRAIGTMVDLESKRTVVLEEFGGEKIRVIGKYPSKLSMVDSYTTFDSDWCGIIKPLYVKMSNSKSPEKIVTTIRNKFLPTYLENLSVIETYKTSKNRNKIHTQEACQKLYEAIRGTKHPNPQSILSESLYTTLVNDIGCMVILHDIFEKSRIVLTNLSESDAEQLFFVIKNFLEGRPK